MSGGSSEPLIPKDEASEEKKKESEARRKLDFIVESDSFLDYPDALFWARMTRAGLIMAIVGCVVVLIATYFGGQLQIDRDIYKYVSIEAPSVVVCPDYGKEFESFEVVRTSIGKLPATSEPATTLDHEAEYGCIDHNLHCRCIDFAPGTMLNHYDDGIHFIRLEFKAKSRGTDTFIFGFNEPGHNDVQEVPHTFNLGLLHRRAMGHLSMREISEKMEKIMNAVQKFDVRSVRAYDYESAGLAVPTENGSTVLTFGFKTFFVPLDRSVNSLLSPFAIMVLLVLCASYVNNLNLYEIFFPVTEHPVFVQREPSSFLRSMCGCLRCTKRVERDDEEAPTQLDDLAKNHHAKKMAKHPWGNEHSKTKSLDPGNHRPALS